MCGFGVQGGTWNPSVYVCVCAQVWELWGWSLSDYRERLASRGRGKSARGAGVPSRSTSSHAGVATAPIPFQLLALAAGEAADSGPSAWVGPLVWETQVEFLAPGLWPGSDLAAAATWGASQLMEDLGLSL